MIGRVWEKTAYSKGTGSVKKRCTVRATTFECTLIGPEHSGEIVGNIAPFEVTAMITNQFAPPKGLNTTYSFK